MIGFRIEKAAGFYTCGDFGRIASNAAEMTPFNDLPLKSDNDKRDAYHYQADRVGFELRDRGDCFQGHKAAFVAMATNNGYPFFAE